MPKRVITKAQLDKKERNLKAKRTKTAINYHEKAPDGIAHDVRGMRLSVMDKRIANLRKRSIRGN